MKIKINILLIICLLVNSNVIYSQTKKEQIQKLVYNNDSLNNSINKMNILIDSTYLVIKRKNIQIDSFINVSNNNQLQIDSLLQKMINLNSKIKILESSFENGKIEFNSQITLLKNLHKKSMDSILNLCNPIERKNIINKNDFLYSFENGFFLFQFKADDTNYPENLNYNGEFKSFFDYAGVRKVYANGFYKNGFKEGKWTYLMCDGSIECEGYYVNGRKNGIWKNFNPCNTSSFINLKGYKRTNDLSFLSFLSDFYNLQIPSLWESVVYENGIIGDTIYFYNNDNKLMFKSSINDSKIYYADNTLFKEGDIKQGFIKLYHPNSQLMSHETFDITSKSIYLLSARNGASVNYYANGKIKSKGNFKNGNGEGEWEYYFENGDIRKKGTWENDNGKYGLDCKCQ